MKNSISENLWNEDRINSKKRGFWSSQFNSFSLEKNHDYNCFFDEKYFLKESIRSGSNKDLLNRGDFGKIPFFINNLTLFLE